MPRNPSKGSWDTRICCPNHLDCRLSMQRCSSLTLSSLWTLQTLCPRLIRTTPRGYLILASCTLDLILSIITESSWTLVRFHHSTSQQYGTTLASLQMLHQIPSQPVCWSSDPFYPNLFPLHTWLQTIQVHAGGLGLMKPAELHLKF